MFVDADLSKYFGTIPHADLLRSVARRVVDRNVLRLIKLWLQVPVEERDGDGRRHSAKGIVVLPRRWVVERTFAWLNRCRRLAKDFENRTRNALAF